MGMICQRHAPTAVPPGVTRYPLCRRLGGPQSRSGRVRKIQPIAGRYTDYAIPDPGKNLNNRILENTGIRRQLEFSSMKIFRADIVLC